MSHREMGRPSHHYYDVWTDAGRAEGDLFCIARHLASTRSIQLQEMLVKAGWNAEMRPAEHDRPPV